MIQGYEFREERRQMLGSDNPHLEKLFKHFKDPSFGEGTEIVGIPEDETSVNKLLSRGDFFPDTTSVRSEYGTVSGCHYNSASLFDEDQENTRIATGYALSKDGLWRCHSWAIESENGSFDENSTIIETTEPRERYFGYILTYKECGQFAKNEIGSFTPHFPIESTLENNTHPIEPSLNITI